MVFSFLSKSTKLCNKARSDDNVLLKCCSMFKKLVPPLPSPSFVYMSTLYYDSRPSAHSDMLLCCEMTHIFSAQETDEVLSWGFAYEAMLQRTRRTRQCLHLWVPVLLENFEMQHIAGRVWAVVLQWEGVSRDIQKISQVVRGIIGTKVQKKRAKLKLFGTMSVDFPDVLVYSQVVRNIKWMKTMMMSTVASSFVVVKIQKLFQLRSFCGFSWEMCAVVLLPCVYRKLELYSQNTLKLKVAPRCHWARGRLHPRQVASLWYDSFSHSHLQPI